ncbi:hypothetical protein GSU75_02239 [Pseudomonas savastanoi pv. phaseolicola]|uniref:Transcriptional regulator n=1 Tax=Pseudomonas savastanoi pv. glycinea TaxID=318 RepID=A0A3M3GJH5_PSESG|nr:hypothetical protein [Pseudomonas savastanoi pv. phaseolicola]RMM74443.1 hypothetical protein ALQ73_01954 [Pseudomonas savastanoi pv. glycinea]
MSVLMQRLASVGGASVALAVGCDEATISRMKPDKFQQFSEILAVLDLKIVPTHMRCFNERDMHALSRRPRPLTTNPASPSPRTRSWPNASYLQALS